MPSDYEAFNIVSSILRPNTGFCRALSIQLIRFSSPHAENRIDAASSPLMFTKCRQRLPDCTFSADAEPGYALCAAYDSLMSVSESLRHDFSRRRHWVFSLSLVYAFRFHAFLSDDTPSAIGRYGKQSFQPMPAFFDSSMSPPPAWIQTMHQIAVIFDEDSDGCRQRIEGIRAVRSAR